ncbi:MAG TPA: S8 family peptidase [Gammaproteobacteria bacterium]|nr:S8 family peptidase [Gammaproteobacteria bacterium]
MPMRPLLIFPAPTTLEKRDARGGGPSKVHIPTAARQIERLTPMFTRLQQASDANRIALQQNPNGLVPEKVLVIETIGPVDDFIVAVRKTNIEWIGEWTEELIPSDEDFFDPEDRERPLSGRLFLTMTNQAALQQLLSLWQRWRGDPHAKMPHGLNKWRDLFSRLKDIRFWGVTDRLSETGILDYWQEELVLGSETVKFEIELWFRNTSEKRAAAEARLAAEVVAAGGIVVQRSLIEDINYHAFLAEIPSVQAAAFVLEQRDEIQFLRCDDVMYFRPVGQAIDSPTEGELLLDQSEVLERAVPQARPIVALLDGLPLQGHRWLADHIIVDDPDGWSATYPAVSRRHGTAMASLLLHGDSRPTETPSSRPIYVRPILKPDGNTVGRERIPQDVLPIDLIHRAVVRLFERSNQQAAISPEVRIINLSVADPNQLFYRTISSWARLLDWLSWRYKVLFIVSAGNHLDSIDLGIPRGNFSTLTPETLRQHTLRSLDRNSRHRRLLCPAEGINVLTVGAIHSDNSGTNTPAGLVDVYNGMTLPSPINPISVGHKHSIKPEILVAGGRVLHREKLGTTHQNATLDVVNYLSAPGQVVASPGPGGVLNAYAYTRGTSNAAAISSRTAAEIYEKVISDIAQRAGARHPLSRAQEVQLIKALLVHGASWGNNYEVLRAILKNERNSQRFRDYIARFLGFGEPDFHRVLSSTDQRATVLGWGQLEGEEGQRFTLPLPYSLNGVATRKRLTTTLAWLSPINPVHQSYRRAQLWVTFPGVKQVQTKLAADRSECDGQAVQRGTIQHEIYVGESPSVFDATESIEINVSCRPDAGALVDSIPYGLAVTLEVAEGSRIPLYTEIEARIRPQVPVRPGQAT